MLSTEVGQGTTNSRILPSAYHSGRGWHSSFFECSLTCGCTVHETRGTEVRPIVNRSSRQSNGSCVATTTSETACKYGVASIPRLRKGPVCVCDGAGGTEAR